MALYGWIPEASGTRSVATKFVSIGALPVWPLRSELIDRATMVVERGRESPFSSWEFERFTYQCAPLPLDRRSILAAYLRSWGVVLAIVGIARLSSETWELILFAGGGACLLGITLRALRFLRVGTYLATLGWGAMLGAFSAGLIPWVAGLGLALLALPAWRSLEWERGAIDVPKMTVVEPKSAPVGQARAQPAAPPAKLAPLPSVAPAHVERVVDQPRLLT